MREGNPCAGLGYGGVDEPELGAPGIHFPLQEIPPEKLRERRRKRVPKVVDTGRFVSRTG